MLEIADPPGAVVVPLRSFSFKTRDGWRRLAMAAALAAFVAGTGTYSILRQDPVSNDVAAIVSDHRRALLAATPYDIASSDRHTVKPWFDSKLALSPQVVDLAASGFPLAGGRVEILDGKAVPVLVYQRRAHVISVVAVPHTGERTRGAVTSGDPRWIFRDPVAGAGFRLFCRLRCCRERT